MKNSKTYVLFGEEAVSIYKLSVNQLLMSKYVKYTVCSFKENEQKKFFIEKLKWDDFIEITPQDYSIIKIHFVKNNLVLPNTKFQPLKILFSKILVLFNRSQKNSFSIANKGFIH